MLLILTFNRRSVKKGSFLTDLCHSSTSRAFNSGFHVVRIERMKGFQPLCGQETVASNSQRFSRAKAQALH
jgi:hypothetical protein